MTAYTPAELAGMVRHAVDGMRCAEPVGSRSTLTDAELIAATLPPAAITVAVHTAAEAGTPEALRVAAAWQGLGLAIGRHAGARSVYARNGATYAREAVAAAAVMRRDAVRQLAAALYRAERAERGTL